MEGLFGSKQGNRLMQPICRWNFARSLGFAKTAVTTPSVLCVAPPSLWLLWLGDTNSTFARTVT